MKTKKFKVFFPDDPVQYSTLAIQNFEYADPIQQISREFIKAEAALQRDLLVYQGIPLSTSLLTEILPQRAREAWTRRYTELSTLSIPDNAIALLDTFSKDRQEYLLRDLVLTHDQLTGLILRAGQHGYTYSQYRVETNLPGSTISSTPKQIKIIKMLDRGRQWHSFRYSIYKSECTGELSGYHGAFTLLYIKRMATHADQCHQRPECF